MKKILAIIAALFLILAAFPMPAMQEKSPSTSPP